MKYILQNYKCCLSRENLEISHQKLYKDIDESTRKTFDYSNGAKLVSGINCTPELSFNEFRATKKLYKKESGKFFYHLDQSFSPKENISPKVAHEIALQFANENFIGFEVVVATHIDRAHIHSHFLVNSVSFDTGKKLHFDKDSIKNLRASSDKICERFGLSTLKQYESGKSQDLSNREYRSAEKGQSWKFRLMNTIDTCMNMSRTKEDFITNLAKVGVKITWSDTRKNITYTTQNGMKCRDNKLHEIKYMKENMENEFRIRQLESQKCCTRNAGQDRAVGDDYTGTMDSNRDQLASRAAENAETGNNVGGNADLRYAVGLSESKGTFPQEGAIDEVSLRANGEPNLTGWELSREKLKEFEFSAGADFGNLQTVTIDINAQNDMVGGEADSHLFHDTVHLLGGISQISETHEPPVKGGIVTHESKTLAKERKKKIAHVQKSNDRSGKDFTQSM